MKSAGMATARPATVASSAEAMPGAIELTSTSPAFRDDGEGDHDADDRANRPT
jgi:hypothetical protein